MKAAAVDALTPHVHDAHIREIQAFRLIALGKPFPTAPRQHKDRPPARPQPSTIAEGPPPLRRVGDLPSHVNPMAAGENRPQKPKTWGNVDPQDDADDDQLTPAPDSQTFTDFPGFVRDARDADSD